MDHGARPELEIQSYLRTFVLMRKRTILSLRECINGATDFQTLAASKAHYLGWLRFCIACIIDPSTNGHSRVSDRVRMLDVDRTREVGLPRGAETMDGRRLFSYGQNPLHVVSYFLPIDREISREELFEHLHVHPKLPDAIPFVFKYYERDWGLCCSANLKKTLRDDKYRVLIRAESSYGTLKVGEVIAPGRSTETFVLCAHLCHPAMVNDDLSGVVVGLKVMQALLARKDLRYTYRFLILPETIGSVAYLSHHNELTQKMVGGLFLEMLGLENPHALQLSFTGDSEADRCLKEVLSEVDPKGWVGAFRTVVGNDERQFNAPGVRVPMLSLSRVMPKGSSDWPYYPQYHSSEDTPECTCSVAPRRVERSCAKDARRFRRKSDSEEPVSGRDILLAIWSEH